MRLREVLAASPDDAVRALHDELAAVEAMVTGNCDPPLSMAFVGQYNAGKSTLISALTDREDIPVDADVCTDTVTAYDWRGIRLLDTPGVQAGYADHDEQTCRCIAQADLLAFVITPELFDDTVGAYFRRLAFEDCRAPEMILVVNKMSMTPATTEVFRPDIERVTRPLAPEDLRTVFVDALAYLEARFETDSSDRAELLEIANLQALEQAIDQFVSDHGLWGRLTTPLYALRSVAHRSAALIGAGTPDDRAQTGGLAQALSELEYSEVRLHGKLEALLSETSADIAEVGDALAKTLVERVSAAEAEQAGTAARQSLQARAEKLEHDALRAFEEEWRDLASRLEHIAASDSSGTLVVDLPTGAACKVEASATEVGATMAPDRTGYVRATETVGETLRRLAAGPRAAEQAGKLVASSGSRAHVAVKEVGGLLGHKFRPWEAVKLAKWIGKVGDVLAKAGPVLTVLLGLIEDRGRKQAEAELAERRAEIRANFRQIAAELAGRFREWANGSVLAAYRAHREYLEEEMRCLRDAEGRASDTQHALDGIIGEAGELISEASVGERGVVG